MLSVSKNTVKLLRIPFSFYLAPVYLLALSQAPSIEPQGALYSFLILHLLVYPASNGYNSYVDRDTGSIGGLESPPLPTSELFRITLLFDLAAVLLAFLFVHPFFASCVLLYILASRAYSAPGVRLKKYPLGGFFVVVFFQGAFTCYMALAGISGHAPRPNLSLLWLLLACSLQLAAAYPLTQVYQHHADKTAGVQTISMLLGVKGTFIFSLLMFVLCNVSFYFYFNEIDDLKGFFLLQLFLLPLLYFFADWCRKVWRDPRAASFRNTMQMNLVSAMCCGTCFSLLFFLRP